MTADRDLKAIIRARMTKTGESYTTARMQLVGAPLVAPVPAPEAPPLHALPLLAEVAVLKVNELSARVRILGSEEQITFRATGACELIPGMIARLTMRKRWSYRGFEYASGDIEDARQRPDSLRPRSGRSPSVAVRLAMSVGFAHFRSADSV